MIGISLGDILDILERLGIPAGLAGIGLLFLILYLRGARSREANPPWAKVMHGEIRQLRQMVESALRQYHRDEAERWRVIRSIESMVQECRTILRMRHGGHGD